MVHACNASANRDEAKTKFRAFGSSYDNYLTDDENDENQRKKLYGLLKDTAPYSRFVEVMEKTKKWKEPMIQQPNVLRLSPLEVAKNFTYNNCR